MLLQYCFIVLLVSSPTPYHPLLPDSHIIPAVPFVPQEKEYCGPAALSTVFRYYGVRIPQEKLAEEIYLRKLSGALNLDMLIAARRHGFAAQVPAGDLHLLKEHLCRGLPVIALVETQPGSGRFHYLVVYGYDDRESKLFVHSGRKEGETIGYREFERAWNGAKNWMLVVEQKNSWP